MRLLISWFSISLLFVRFGVLLALEATAPAIGEPSPLLRPEAVL